MERFFQERGQYGASELMRPAGPGSVCPETRERQQMENDLYIVTRRLKRKPLSLGDMRDFQAWKMDLMEAWAAMCLPIADYQSTVNQLVINRLDADVRATVADLLPESEEDLMAQKPEELLHQIGERLEDNPAEEHQRLRFNLAK